MKKFWVSLFLASVAAWGITTWQVRRVEKAELQEGYARYLSDRPGFLFELLDGKLAFDNPAIATQVVPVLDIHSRNFPLIAREQISANVSGFLKVKEAGAYSFALASDDGALLKIDGLPVLDNPGYHSFRSVKGRKFLSQGWHFILIRYKNLAGEGGLKLSWGKSGESRKKPVGSDGEIFLPRNLPVNKEPFPAPRSEERLRLNQLRAGTILLALLTILFFFRADCLKRWGRAADNWGALAVFALGLALRWIYFAAHLHRQISGIMDGGDNYFFLTLPLRFVTHGEFISLQCGNLPLLIPLLGTLYKYFCFFPGLHYYAVLMLILGSLVPLFPWLLLRRAAPWAGLVAGLFLAANPILIEFKMPYVSSDPLGFFTFSLAIFFCVKALQDGRWSSHLLAGISLALLPLSRTVYIVLAPLLALFLCVVSSRRGRAAAGFLLFAGIVAGYDYWARTLTHDSYFLFYLRDGMRATVVHRTASQPHGWWQMALWLPRYWPDYFKMVFDNLLPEAVPGAVWRWGMSAIAVAAAAVGAWKRPRIFLFLFAAAGIYLAEISSYHVHPRLLFPLMFVLGLVLAFGLAQGKSLRWERIWKIIFAVFLVGASGMAAVQGRAVWLHKKEEKAFLSWVKKEAPQKSILLTDDFIDPWLLLRQTGLPVFFQSTLTQTLVVSREVTPTSRVLFLAKQSQLPNYLDSHGAAIFNHHGYVLDGLARQGYHYLVVQESFANRLENFYFKEALGMSINPKHYRLEKWRDYPADPQKGIWILKRTAEPLENPPDFTPPPYPADLDRFLSPTY